MSYNPYYAGNEATVNDRFSQHIPPQGQPQPMQQHMQQHMQQPMQQPMQQQQQGGYGFQDPSQNMAFQLGQTAFSNFLGQQNFNQFQETMSKAATVNSSLSLYFQVTTTYVINKLRVILVPFTNKNWQRIPDAQQNSGSDQLSFLAPKDDLNSPDMYIPIMGLVTYILIWNTQEGLKGSFNPENLYYKLSSTVAFVFLDLAILKLGLYLLVSTNSKTTNLTELVCFVGYKFVPLILASFVPKQPIYLKLLAQVYLFIAFGVFLLRSVKFNLFATSNSDMATFNKSTVRKCNYFLFVYGFIWQSILMWLMG